MLVKLGKIGYEVLDDVGVRERVNAGLFGSLGWDAAWSVVSSILFVTPTETVVIR